MEFLYTNNFLLMDLCSLREKMCKHGFGVTIIIQYIINSLMLIESHLMAIL